MSLSFIDILFAKLTIAVFLLVQYECRAQEAQREKRMLVIERKPKGQNVQRVTIPVGKTISIGLKDEPERLSGKIISVSDSTLTLNVDKKTYGRDTTVSFALKRIKVIARNGSRGARIAGFILIPAGWMLTVVGSLVEKTAFDTPIYNKGQQEGLGKGMIVVGIVSCVGGVGCLVSGGIFNLEKGWRIVP